MDLVIPAVAWHIGQKVVVFSVVGRQRELHIDPVWQLHVYFGRSVTSFLLSVAMW